MWKVIKFLNNEHSYKEGPCQDPEVVLCFAFDAKLFKIVEFVTRIVISRNPFFRYLLRQNKMTATPSVVWAQREKIVFVTINVSDVKDPEIKVKLTIAIKRKNSAVNSFFVRSKRIFSTSKEPQQLTRKSTSLT